MNVSRRSPLPMNSAIRPIPRFDRSASIASSSAVERASPRAGPASRPLARRLSRSEIYRLLSARTIQARKISKRTLILWPSLKSRLDGLPAATFRPPR